MKTLILGQGKLGKEIRKQTNWDFLSRADHQIDVDTFDEWKDQLAKYDIIINCIANTDTYSEDEESHRKTNFKFVVDLANFCSEFCIKLIHISTDYVYAECQPDASENEMLKPAKGWYSYTKALADEYVKTNHPEFLVCRLSHKERPFPYESAWLDVRTNADYTDVIVKLVIQLIEREAIGVYNVGTWSKTLLQLSHETRDTKATYSPTYVPKNVTMDLTKLKKLLNEAK
jgi:nucleoside-diphosphate-sugar epimerase